MHTGLKIAEVAALAGDQARANMLTALMDGRALTASELAFFAHVTPQTASSHLAQLVEGGLLSLAKQGRHRYFRLASAQIGQMLESIMAVAETRPQPCHPHWRGGKDLRFARVCYDHLAGELAVRIAEALAAQNRILLTEEGGEVTPDGTEFLSRLGIDTEALSRQRRLFCRPCLDWSMRRPHIAGAVGGAMLQRFMEQGWFRRIKDSRALAITPEGRQELKDWFDITDHPLAEF